jgi:hypothetical protein
MRHLIVAGVLALALPAFATENFGSATGVAAPDEVAPTLESVTGEAAAEVVPALAVAAPTPERVPLGSVARRTFATAIDNREPVDSVTSLGSDRDLIYYFNEFVGISGRRVMHRWAYQGEVVAEVPIHIGGPRWRAYSSKNLDATRLGEWTVSVVDESGRVVQTDSFVYEAAATAPEIAAPAASPASPAASFAAPAALPEPPAAPAPTDAPMEERAGSETAQP